MLTSLQPKSVAGACIALAVSLLLPFAPARAASDAELIGSPEPGWPQFRGPKRDGISPETGLLKEWPEEGPKRLWSASDLGTGFSSPTIHGDRIFITGDRDGELHIFALSLDGKKLWQAKNGPEWKNPYPGARATVTYRDGRVYSHNAHGRMACFDATSGKELWAVDGRERFGGKEMTWGLSECPLVDDRAVYMTAGGSDALAVALDRKTGEVIWKSAPLQDSAGQKDVEGPSYVSPILVKFGGKQLLVGCSLKHLYCIDAANGEIQWTRRLPTQYGVLAMMPTLVEDSIFMTAPHGTGGFLFRLKSESGGRIGFEEVWKTKLDTCQGCVVYTGDKLLGAFYPGRKGWGAVSPKTGEVIYSAPNLIKGAGLYADERLYALSENGWMHLLEAGEKEFTIKGKFRLAEAARNDAWAHPVIHAGLMYLRYHGELHCYDVREPGVAVALR